MNQFYVINVLHQLQYELTFKTKHSILLVMNNGLLITIKADVVLP